MEKRTLWRDAKLAEIRRRYKLIVAGYVYCPHCDGLGSIVNRYSYAQRVCERCDGLGLIPPNKGG